MRPRPHTMLRLGVGAVFVLAGILKLRDPFGLVAAVLDYEIVGGLVAVWFGLAVPCIELAAGVALVASMCTRGAAVVSTMLVVAFLAAQVAALARGLSIECACFSSPGLAPSDPSDRVGILSISRTAFIAIACIALVVLEHRTGRLRDAVSLRSVGLVPDAIADEVSQLAERGQSR